MTLAREIIPDIIITDVMMPGIDGLEVCRQIRKDSLVNHIPIIMVTARITEADKYADWKPERTHTSPSLSMPTNYALAWINCSSSVPCSETSLLPKFYV